MTAEPGRRPALDTLRIVIVLGLVFFHAALVFDASDDFSVKNAETTGVTTIPAGLGVVWAMPLLFVVAGVGARHSLRNAVTISLAVIFAVYDILVRRTTITRFLFGMRERTTQAERV